MYRYAVKLIPDKENGGFSVLCDAISELVTQGDSQEDALTEALDALDTALSIYTDERRPIPQALPAKPDETVLDMPLITVAKIILWNALLEAGISQAELAQQIGISAQAAGRLFDFLHTSKIESIEKALRALGKQLEVSVKEAA